MRIAYLTNQYPAVSHTFIRQELREVESLGFSVLRVAVRRPRESIIDAADKEEMRQTRYLLDGGAFRIVTAAAGRLLTHPRAMLNALARCAELGWGAERGIVKHLAYLAEACVLERWLREEGVEHVHVHFGTNPAAVALLCNALGGPPFSITIHGPEEFLRPEAMRIAAKCRGAKFVVGISGYGVTRLKKIAGPGAADRVHLVRCGVGQAFRGAKGSPVPDVQRLVCVGRLCHAKQQEVLVRAAAHVAQREPGLEVVLVGDGPCRARLEEVAAELGAPVRFAGSLDGSAVREALRSARAMVLPSRAEGLPVAIMEAFALERPVISTPVGGIAELVVPGVNGWLVPSGSVKALAEAIQDVLATDTTRLREMGRAGRAMVLAHHDAAREAAVLAGLFEGRQRVDDDRSAEWARKADAAAADRWAAREETPVRSGAYEPSPEPTRGQGEKKNPAGTGARRFPRGDRGSD